MHGQGAARARADIGNFEEASFVPRGKKLIPSKHVFKVKLHATGEVGEFKTRATIKGSHQRQCQDYLSTLRRQAISPCSGCSWLSPCDTTFRAISQTSHQHFCKVISTQASTWSYPRGCTIAIPAALVPSSSSLPVLFMGRSRRLSSSITS